MFFEIWFLVASNPNQKSYVKNVVDLFCEPQKKTAAFLKFGPLKSRLPASPSVQSRYRTIVPRRGNPPAKKVPNSDFLSVTWIFDLHIFD